MPRVGGSADFRSESVQLHSSSKELNCDRLIHNILGYQC